MRLSITAWPLSPGPHGPNAEPHARDLFPLSSAARHRMPEVFVYGRGYGGMFGPTTHLPGTPIPRSVVRNEVLAFECDMRFPAAQRVLRGWGLTSHRHQTFAFAKEEHECDSRCGRPIRAGQLMSVGLRQVEGDMEIENDQYDVAGVDRIHFECRLCMQDEGKDHVHSAYCNAYPLSLKGQDVRAFPGFGSLSKAEQVSGPSTTLPYRRRPRCQL